MLPEKKIMVLIKVLSVEEGYGKKIKTNEFMRSGVFARSSLSMPNPLHRALERTTN